MSRKTVRDEVLPKGWRDVQLGDVVSLRKEKLDPTASTRSIPCIELEHIEKGTGKITSQSSTAGKLSTKNIFYAGDMLYGKLRPNLKKYAWISKYLSNAVEEAIRIRNQYK